MPLLFRYPMEFVSTQMPEITYRFPPRPFLASESQLLALLPSSESSSQSSRFPPLQPPFPFFIHQKLFPFQIPSVHFIDCPQRTFPLTEFHESVSPRQFRHHIPHQPAPHNRPKTLKQLPQLVLINRGCQTAHKNRTQRIANDFPVRLVTGIHGPHQSPIVRKLIGAVYGAHLYRIINVAGEFCPRFRRRRRRQSRRTTIAVTTGRHCLFSLIVFVYFVA